MVELSIWVYEKWTNWSWYYSLWAAWFELINSNFLDAANIRDKCLSCCQEARSSLFHTRINQQIHLQKFSCWQRASIIKLGA